MQISEAQSGNIFGGWRGHSREPALEAGKRYPAVIAAVTDIGKEMFPASNGKPAKEYHKCVIWFQCEGVGGDGLPNVMPVKMTASLGSETYPSTLRKALSDMEMLNDFIKAGGDSEWLVGRMCMIKVVKKEGKDYLVVKQYQEYDGPQIEATFVPQKDEPEAAGDASSIPF